MKEYKVKSGDINLFFVEKDITVSTNEDAKALKKHGAVVIAKKQTGGKGRLGKTFISNEGGIYMSLYLKAQYLKKITADITFITGAAAVSAAEVIEKLNGIKTEIKWVNDVYQNNKKVCGILAEAETQNGEITGVVLGIGVNLLKTAEFPEEIKEIAGFVFKKGNFENLKDEFCTRFFDLLFLYLNNKAYVYKIYNEKNFLLNKKINFGDNQSGEVKGVDEDLSLIVDKNGERVNLRFGEVEIKKD